MKDSDNAVTLADEPFNKVQHFLMITILNKLGIEIMYLKIPVPMY